MELIRSRKNENITRLKKLLNDRRFRLECGEFACEGEKLFREAVMWGADIVSAFVCEGFEGELPPSVRKFDVSRDILEYVSTQKTPQNIIFTCKIRDNIADDRAGCNIVLENIQDPGNVGTILRSAGAFKIKSVMLLGDCADVYNPKTIRASMGAVFRCNVYSVDYDELFEMKKSGAVLYGASLGEKSREIGDVSLKNVTVCIGNEGNGLTDKILDMCDEHIIIPMAADCESLNAAIAASIVMWEMSKVN